MALEVAGTFDSLGFPNSPGTTPPSTTSMGDHAHNGLSATATPEPAAPTPPSNSGAPMPSAAAPILTPVMSVPVPTLDVLIPTAVIPATNAAAPLSNAGSRAEHSDGVEGMLADVERSIGLAILDMPASLTQSVLITPAPSRDPSLTPLESIDADGYVAPASREPFTPSRGTGVGSKRPAPSTWTKPISPPQKRSCPPTRDILPSDAPPWIKTAVEMLAGISSRTHWQELIAAWIVYEGKQDFKDVGRLSPKGRPKIVGEWIKNARKPAWRPRYVLLANCMVKDHNAWWASLQPTWRHRDDGTLETSVAGGDWDGLHIYGSNGLLSALASLFFWATALGDPDSDTEEWDAAVGDCLWVIRQLSTLH